MLDKQIKNQGYVLTDGAMGTYYYEMTAGQGGVVEMANLTKPDMIKKIHEQYIEAGATMIRTNSFNANKQVLEIGDQELEKVLTASYQIAKEAIGERQVDLFISIGPIPEDNLEEQEILDQYLHISDVFLGLGATGFIFETFSQMSCLKEVSSHIKKKAKNAKIITQFAVDATGHTKQGVPIAKILREIQKIDTIDHAGLNCGVGPMHMNRIIGELFKQGVAVATALPNAGYPHIIDERTVYPGNPLYFSELLSDINGMGVPIIGGCCGTTPIHIRSIKRALDKALKTTKVEPTVIQSVKEDKRHHGPKSPRKILDKILMGKKVTMVELDPPYGVQIDKIMKGASILKDVGVDMITIADSPLGRPRADAVMIGAKIKRELGIEVMPHLCCRDKNVIGLKSKILGAHLEGIRYLLAVTGDPVPSANRGEIKGVFNLNSIQLMAMIEEMNEELLEEDAIIVAGALNPNVANMDKLKARLEKKAKNGAQIFLTQPIYDDATIEQLKELKEQTGIKVMAGIMPLVSLRNALYLDNEVPGIVIPDEDIQKFHRDMTREEAEAVGVDMAVQLCKKLEPIADGYYFMTPFNRATMIKKIIQAL